MRAFLTLVLTFFSLNVYSFTTVEEAANQLKDVIVEKQIDRIKLFPCYPVQHQCFSNYTFEYIFNENDKAIYKILSNPNVQVRVYDPYEDGDKKIFTVVYFLPYAELFNEKGLMSLEIQEKNWNVNYAETTFVESEGKIYINRTLFYYGAHLPWVGDYG